MNENKLSHNAISELVIGAAFLVANTLGSGFLEKVYENALVHQLRKAGLDIAQQAPVKVVFDGVIVGSYVCDMVVNGIVMVEVKAVRALDNTHQAQCMNYLTATGLKLCLLLNFARPRIEIRRIVKGLEAA